MTIGPASVGDDTNGPSDRLALTAVAAQFFVNGAVIGSVIPRLPGIRDQVGITASQVGLMMSIAGLGGLLGSAVSGRAIERFGTRRVMLVAATVVALALPVIGLSDGPVLLAIGLLLMMTFDVPVDVAMNLQGSWLSKRRSVPVMNRLHGLWSLGAMVGGLVSSRLAQADITVRSHLVGAAIVLLVLLAVISRGLLTTDAPGDDSVSDGGTHGAASPKPGARTLSSRTVGLVLLVLAGYTALAVEATSIDWSPFRFTDDLGTSASLAAWAYAAVTGGMTIGRFGGDWAAVRLGKDRLLEVAMVLTAAGLATASLVDNADLGLFGYAAAGLGIAVFLPEIYDRAARFPGRPGAGLGALTAGLRLAALTIPALVGFLINVTGSVGTAVALSALPSVAGFALVVWRLRVT